MRFPMKNGEPDTAMICDMFDLFLSRGFNYFDTAHGYMNGKSEGILKKCLTSRYGRDKYILTNKLSTNFFTENKQIRPLFESQLVSCGVDFFDCYLMHAQDRENYEKYKRCGAYETALELKREGKIRTLGISFHDNADVLERILSEQPQTEIVQIQFNYADYDDPSVESRKCYEVCEKYGKPVIVMEPVKGGCLADLPAGAKKVFDSLGNASYASYAIRFAAGFPNIAVVLSGMSNTEQVMDNTGYMQDFKPLSCAEKDAVKKVLEIFRKQDFIPCTSCRYCTEVCPKQIEIPVLFSLLNTKKRFGSWNTDYYYDVSTHGKAKASDCLGCGKCEKACPQHLGIRKLLRDVAAEFEKKQNI